MLPPFDNTTFAQIATVGAGVTAYTNSSLTTGTAYFYRVRSTDAQGDSTYFNTISAAAK